VKEGSAADHVIALRQQGLQLAASEPRFSVGKSKRIRQLHARRHATDFAPHLQLLRESGSVSHAPLMKRALGSCGFRKMHERGPARLRDGEGRACKRPSQSHERPFPSWANPVDLAPLQPAGIA
jgi:hypothetical protein